jgi:excisionase family DNA binding protein
MDRKDGLHTTITVPEIASRMGICEETVYDMLRKHEIPNLRHGRRFIVSRTAFERWESTIGEGAAIQPEAQPIQAKSGSRDRRLHLAMAS